MSNYFERLHKVIPGGCHTYSKGHDQFPSNAPEILVKGDGCYVFSPDGSRLLDYGMGLRSVALGYSYPEVNAAAIEALSLGNNLTRPSVLELEAAELFVANLPFADMVKFCKNGSNATTAAIKLARAYTGKRYICIPQQHPFFSFDDWFIGTTDMDLGVEKSTSSCILKFDYNDVDSLHRCFDRLGEQIAGVLMEPVTHLMPCYQTCEKPSIMGGCTVCKQRNFLKDVKNLCINNNSLFILDEMITGYRWSVAGASPHFDVTPDLATFGKAMANGFSVAAVTGRRDIMELGSTIKAGQRRLFLLSSTHGAEMASLAAFIATRKVYEESSVCNHLWKFGYALKEGMNEISKRLGVYDFFRVIGPSPNLQMEVADETRTSSSFLRTLFAQEMIRNGVLMPWIAPSFSHKEDELSFTLDAVERSLKIFREAVFTGKNELLVGRSVQAVFRKYN